MNIKQSNSKHIYILGAGPAGLASAYTLTKQDESVVVVDKDSQVGGLSKSIVYQGFILDYGAHYLCTSPQPVLELFNEILGSNKVNINTLIRVYWRKKFLSYPPKIHELLSVLSWEEIIKVISSYLQAKIYPNASIENYHEQLSSRFGKYLFEIFFKDYIEKVWGISGKQISANAVARVTTNLFEKYLNIFIQLIHNWFTSKSFTSNVSSNQVLYPKKGSGQFYKGIAHYICSQNQQVLLDTEVVQVKHNSFLINELVLKNLHTGPEEAHKCRGVISSIPINLLLQKLSPSPPERILNLVKYLKFRNTILAYLIIEGNQIFPEHSLYINDKSVQVVRVTNFANWSPDILPNCYQTPLCCEYWCDFNESIWQLSDQEILVQAEQELREIGLLAQQTVSSGFVVRLARTHPIYTVNYQTALLEIQDYLKQFQNLQIVGRGGSFSYFDQDMVLLMGMSSAKDLLNSLKAL
ncbi:hypothetical protein BCD64_20550 [Nostoc sp. MBR 210]|nr:hypothetical protein BCD64_20550 [Nostoc sp. MBR 210]